jgi:transposase
MRVRTLLNQCYKFKSFVYVKECLEHHESGNRIVVHIQARKNGHPICSGCHKPGSTYDHQPQARYFEFVPLWGMAVLFCYVMRRVNCRRCGVKVERVPWCEGKHQLTTAYQLFLARWARRLSWKEVAEVFNTSWEKVYHSVSHVVSYGLKHRDLQGIESMGVDEIQYGQGHQYLTLVYQIDSGCKRLLAVTKERTIKSFLCGLRSIGKDNLSTIQYVCSDMWPAYLKVIKKKFPQALHVLDRFHIAKKLNEAVDEVRREETKRLRAEGYEPVLKDSRFCFLKNQENLTDKQVMKLDELLEYDLKSVRAYLLKESFQAFWQYTHPAWANKFLTAWCNKAMRSQLKPIKKFVRTVRRHQELMMNWFKAKKAYSSGVVEGLNRKINLVTRRAYGYKSFDVLKIALFHTMGGLPEPEMTHRFC